MVFSNGVIMQIMILVLGLYGFFVAKHIRNHKTKNTPLICPVGFDCHAVVHSDYSKFFNIPVEIFGMMYYALVFFSYALRILIPDLTLFILRDFLVMISFVAFLFSLYLIFVQVFILKKGCSWCIVSAIISALIFVLTIVTYF